MSDVSSTATSGSEFPVVICIHCRTFQTLRSPRASAPGWFEHGIRSATKAVLDEAAAGDAQAAQERMAILLPLPLLDISDAVLELAAAILESGIIPSKAARDAAHIAVSAVHAIDFLLTWNCAHIANAQIVKQVRVICSQGCNRSSAKAISR